MDYAILKALRFLKSFLYPPGLFLILLALKELTDAGFVLIYICRNYTFKDFVDGAVKKCTGTVFFWVLTLLFMTADIVILKIALFNSHSGGLKFFVQSLGFCYLAEFIRLYLLFVIPYDKQMVFRTYGDESIINVIKNMVQSVDMNKFYDFKRRVFIGLITKNREKGIV